MEVKIDSLPINWLRILRRPWVRNSSMAAASLVNLVSGVDREAKRCSIIRSSICGRESLKLVAVLPAAGLTVVGTSSIEAGDTVATLAASGTGTGGGSSSAVEALEHPAERLETTVTGSR